MNLAMKRNFVRLKVSSHAKYLGGRSFHFKVIVQTHKHTHSGLTALSGPSKGQ